MRNGIVTPGIIYSKTPYQEHTDYSQVLLPLHILASEAQLGQWDTWNIASTHCRYYSRTESSLYCRVHIYCLV